MAEDEQQSASSKRQKMTEEDDEHELHQTAKINLDTLSNDILLSIFSSQYLRSEELVRLALTCRRFGTASTTDGRSLSLVNEAAKQIVDREIGGLRWYQKEEIHDSDPWTKQYYDLEGIIVLISESVNLYHLWNEDAVDTYLERFEKKKDKIGTMMINGPEFYDDSEDEDSEPPSVPDGNVERLLTSISNMQLPNLRDLWVDPSHHSERDNIILHSSRLCWLLSSGKSQFKNLRISNLYVKNDVQLADIAKAFISCTSMKKLSIDQLVLGGQPVETVDVLMKVLAELPNLKTISIVFETHSFWGEDKREDRLNRYVDQSLSILRPRFEDIAVKQVRRFYRHQCPQLSN